MSTTSSPFGQSAPKPHDEEQEILTLFLQEQREKHPETPIPPVFCTAQYAHYHQKAFATSPAAAHATLRERGEAEHRQGFISLTDLNNRFPKDLSDKEQEQQEVWELWRDDVPLYDPYHVYKLIGYKETFTSWRTRYELPKLLTARQAGYLVERAVASNPHAANAPTLRVEAQSARTDRLKARPPKALPTSYSTLFNWKAPKHPWPVGAMNHHVKTKVGNVYGTWKFLSCISDNENTSGNRSVHYQVMCVACGHQQELNYRRMSAPCPACMTQFKGKLRERETDLRHTITVYYMDDKSFMVSNTVPAGAIGRLVFTNRSMKHYIEFFTEADKGTFEATTVDTQPAEPEVAKPETFLPTSDMPF